MRKVRNMVVYDNREHLFLVEGPHGNMGTWTQSLEKAYKFTKGGAFIVSNMYPSMDLIAMTVKDAKAMLKRATFVARRIV